MMATWRFIMVLFLCSAAGIQSWAGEKDRFRVKPPADTSNKKALTPEEKGRYQDVIPVGAIFSDDKGEEILGGLFDVQDDGVIAAFEVFERKLFKFPPSNFQTIVATNAKYTFDETKKMLVKEDHSFEDSIALIVLGDAISYSYEASQFLIKNERVQWFNPNHGTMAWRKFGKVERGPFGPRVAHGQALVRIPWGVYEDQPHKILTKTVRYTFDNEKNIYTSEKMDGEDLESINLALLRYNDPKNYAVVKAERDERKKKERDARTAAIIEGVIRLGEQYAKDHPEPETKNIEVTVVCKTCSGKGRDIFSFKCSDCNGTGMRKKTVKVLK